MGRFSAIDIFHTKGRRKEYDWIIYLGLFLLFVGLYTLVASWRLLSVKCKRTKSFSDLSNLSNSELLPETAESDTEEVRIKKSQLIMESEQNGNYLVKIEGLRKSYGNNKVLKNFSLSIKAGEVMCLLGSNGSGKTTLVNMLTGLEKLEENGGSVTLNFENR